MKKRLKGLGALALVLTMLLSMVPMAAAEGTTWQSEGNYDVSWLNDDPVNGAYVIETAAELAGLSVFLRGADKNQSAYPYSDTKFAQWREMKDASEVVIRLAADLDMSRYEWDVADFDQNNEVVGKEFSGFSLDGNGHVISGIRGDFLFSGDNSVRLINVGLEDVELTAGIDAYETSTSGINFFLTNSYMVGEFQEEDLQKLTASQTDLYCSYIYDTEKESGFLRVSSHGLLADVPVDDAQLRGTKNLSGPEYEQNRDKIVELLIAGNLPVPALYTAENLLNASVTYVNEYEALYQNDTPFLFPWYTDSNLNHGFPQFRKPQSDSGIPGWIFGGSGIGSNPFADVPNGAWFTDAVVDVNARGVMTGVAYDAFAPYDVVTRAQLVTALWRLEGQPMDAENADFSDVELNSWYSYAVNWAAAFDIVEGDNGKFMPHAPVTREQMAAILYRYTQYVGGDWLGSADLSSFSDGASVSGYAVDAVRWAVAQNLMVGSNGRLNPQSALTRAEMAAVLSRYLG